MTLRSLTIINKKFNLNSLYLLCYFFLKSYFYYFLIFLFFNFLIYMQYLLPLKKKNSYLHLFIYNNNNNDYQQLLNFINIIVTINT